MSWTFTWVLLCFSPLIDQVRLPKDWRNTKTGRTDFPWAKQYKQANYTLSMRTVTFPIWAKSVAEFGPAACIILRINVWGALKLSPYTSRKSRRSIHRASFNCACKEFNRRKTSKLTHYMERLEKSRKKRKRRTITTNVHVGRLASNSISPTA